MSFGVGADGRLGYMGVFGDVGGELGVKEYGFLIQGSLFIVINNGGGGLSILRHDFLKRCAGKVYLYHNTTQTCITLFLAQSMLMIYVI